MSRKNKLDDPDDVALNDGHGYFVDTAACEKYLSIAQPLPGDETDETCSYSRAARLQNVAKFKNAVITGVVAVQCARHGFYLPNGMVGLKRGEATKEQNDGHRHDSIDETSGHWIWDKLIKLTDTLWSESRDQELVERWQREEVTFASFEPKVNHGPPTHAAAYKKLAEQELANAKLAWKLMAWETVH
ncbi:hypothetical protein C8R45DRAFT_1093018 [Mycena sanguinolenta]|nr:hypothetical protein C8R45DRAFT_1093018 [Mycena sanguinolenta]